MTSFLRFLAAVLLLFPIWVSAASEKESIEEISSSLSSITEEQIPALTEKANAGDSKAQLLLGFAYFYGRGITKDNDEANKWLEKAGEQGNILAQYQLGVNYATPATTAKPDFDQAAKWYAKAAKQGNAEAQFRLGTHYRMGAGVAQSDADAVKWFQKAADQGHAEAQWSLGLMYQRGFGIAKSEAAAAKWYRLSAEQGFAKAEYYLATLYELGMGVPKDNVSAYKWHTVAVAMGEPSALRFREYLAERMTQKEITTGQQQATKWLSQHQQK